MRSRQEVEASKSRVEAALTVLRQELNALESELRALNMPIRLNDAFFYDHVVGILEKSELGHSSAELRRELTAKGFEVPEVNFRTFLSRQKDKGNLNLEEKARGLGRWSLTRDRLVGR